MIISSAPESYKETEIYKRLQAESNAADGLIEKATVFINTVRPLQELIISGPFKDYTLHNPNHSKKLMHLAGFVISSETLQNLSKLELTILIMSFYLHDLGLVVTVTERERIIESQAFKDFLQIKSDYSDKIDKLRLQIKNDEENKIVKEIAIYQLYEAALSDYLRPLHATNERYLELISQIKGSSGRNDLFEISGVSFEKELIDICISHNLDANTLLESKGIYEQRYPREEILNGEVLNAQFCCAVLRLVDILDFDRERTPISLFNSLGIQYKKLPGYEISLKEWNKHLAVHTLSINSNEILVSADSNHPSIEHSILEFCKIIENEIRETLAVINQNTNEILKRYYLKLPFNVRAKIRSIGYVYKDYSIKLNENAIINLLMGENLYLNPQIAIRELIQNSIDACKVKRALNLENYTPSIRISIKSIDERRWLVITDNGIGMDDHVLSNYFFKVGNSYYSSQEFKKFTLTNNVLNFTPISRFGIGMVSVFMIGEVIKVITKNSSSTKGDFKERTLLIDGTESLAVVTESDRGIDGTQIEVLLRKGQDDESSLRQLYGFVKDNVIRPEIPVELTDFQKSKITIQPANYITFNKKAKAVLDKKGIEMIEIDLNRFSNLLNGKCFFFFFKSNDELLSYYDKNQKLGWALYPLRENFLFENFIGGSRITVNGMAMKMKKIGSLYNIGKRQAAAVLDVEVKGIKEIEYDVSRDRVFGKGLFTIRREIFSTIEKAFSETGFNDRLDEETKGYLNACSKTKLPTSPLNKDLLKKIKALIPENQPWPTGLHKSIAQKLNIANSTATIYITAMIHMKMIEKP